MLVPAAKEEPVFPLAALLTPKPNQGLPTKNPAPHPALDDANSTAAIGLRASLLLNGTRQSERARYYGSSLGRFTSPDPSNLSVDFWMPQTWNRYSYALNNPHKMVDKNGLWPWPIHNEIIRQAFPGMSADQLKTLRDASWNMDYGPGQQGASRSYQHGMSDGLTSQDPAAAEEEGNAFIATNDQVAQKAQADWIASGHTGISPKALAAFGNALHTATDRTSPAHVGNQPWYGAKWWQTQSIIHYQQSVRSPLIRCKLPWMQLDKRSVTFGNEFDWMLLLMRQGGACVTVHDSASGTAFGGCQ